MNNYKYCTGCRACEQVCPKDCIEIIADKEGFLTPKIDECSCIHCDLCIKVCSGYELNANNIKYEANDTVYACYAKQDSLRENSSSGGIFAVISEYIIEQKGAVFGTGFDESFYLHHYKVDNKTDLIKLKGSKYIQSDTMSTYSEVKEKLKDGRFVYFTGTPCQIAGLRLFLGNEYDNLLTSDFICHGVPSPLFFNKYKDYLEKKINGEMVDFKFRKSNGWAINEEYLIKKKTKSIKRVVPKNISSYFQAYLRGDLNRLSCYDCQYATESRVGDITLADFWGIENYIDIDIHKGVSLVLVNSERGDKIMKSIRDKLTIYKVPVEFAKGNGNLYMSSEKSEIREVLYEKLNTQGFGYLCKNELKIKGMYMVKNRNRITSLLDDLGVKKSIKKLLGK